MRYSRYIFYAVSLIAFLGLVGCTEKAMQARGFVLPPGDPDLGRAAFISMQCQQCHTVAGIELPADDQMRDGPVLFELGGDVTAVKTYGQLVTAIIHPSESISGSPLRLAKPDGESWMTDYNRAMTVDELIHIVAFLKPTYRVRAPGYIMP